MWVNQKHIQVNKTEVKEIQMNVLWAEYKGTSIEETWRYKIGNEE